MSILKKIVKGFNTAFKKKNEIDDDNFDAGKWKNVKNNIQPQTPAHENIESVLNTDNDLSDQENLNPESIVSDDESTDEYQEIAKNNMKKFNEDEKPRILGLKRGLIKGIIIVLAITFVSSFLYNKYGRNDKNVYNSQSKYHPATTASTDTGPQTYPDLAQSEQNKENTNKTIELNREKKPVTNKINENQKTPRQSNQNYSAQMPVINSRQYNPSTMTIPSGLLNQQNQPVNNAQTEKEKAYSSAISFSISSKSNVGQNTASTSNVPGNDSNNNQTVQGTQSAQATQTIDNGIYKPIQQELQENSISAGSMIPAMLLTGFNSDIKNGQVIAQLTSDTYDSLYGQTLLIPAGSRLIGSTSSTAQNGQGRVDIEWQTLLLPDGSSYKINGAMSCSENGYQGINGNVNNHNAKKIWGGMLSSAIAALGTIASGNNSYSDYGWRNSGQLAAQGASSNLLNTASTMFQKNLNTQATVTINPGTAFNVYLKKQIVLEPY